jgi:gas vesicle protein
MNKDNTISFGIGLLCGAVIGCAIALLYAPQSGSQTREYIGKKVEDASRVVRAKLGKGTLRDAKGR